MVIKIDVDGVIRDIVSAMCLIYNERFNGKLSVDDIDDYDVNNSFTEIIKQTGKLPTEYFFTDLGEEIFETVSKPFYGVKEAINILRKYNNKVVIVTWQFNLMNKIHTLRFLDKYGIKYDDICFTKDKWMIHGDFLIDDNPEFISDERDKSEKIIVDTPYNRHITQNCIRVNSLLDAARYIIRNQKTETEAA